MAILDDSSNMFDEKSVSFQPVVLKWGMISAGVSIVTTLLTSIAGLKMTNMSTLATVGLLGLVVGITILVMAVREHRDQQLGGFISFGRAFLVCLLVLVISTIVAQIFSYLYMNFINPAAAQEAVEAAKTMMEKFGLPEDQIDAAMEKAAADLKSPMSIIKNSAGSIFFGAIIALIMGAIMKKEPSKFA